MTWLSFCARRPGPEWKQGYGTGDRTLAQIEGVVDHSMEGTMAGAYSVLDGPRQSSWTFSIPKVGEPVQHYPLEKIPWHCGLPGDRRTDTSLIGNLTLGGKEHEGRAGEPWTENQIWWSAKIDVAMRVLCPQYGKNPPTLRLNTWWHTWLSATSCPSGRNPDEEKFRLINEWEDDMPTEAEIKQWIIEAIQSHEGLPHGPHYSFKQITDNIQGLNSRLIGEVNDLIEASAGGSYTDEKAVKAVKDKLS